MRFGFVVPYADAREFADLAALGEQRGWDAVFTWESVWGLHAWVTLGAAAMVACVIPSSMGIVESTWPSAAAPSSG